jgi:hypothetical protein
MVKCTENGVLRNFESPEHAFGAGDVFETATRSRNLLKNEAYCDCGAAVFI